MNHCETIVSERASAVQDRAAKVNVEADKSCRKTGLPVTIPGASYMFPTSSINLPLRVCLPHRLRFCT